MSQPWYGPNGNQTPAEVAADFRAQLNGAGLSHLLDPEYRNPPQSGGSSRYGGSPQYGGPSSSGGSSRYGGSSRNGGYSRYGRYENYPGPLRHDGPEPNSPLSPHGQYLLSPGEDVADGLRMLRAMDRWQGRNGHRDW